MLFSYFLHFGKTKSDHNRTSSTGTCVEKKGSKWHQRKWHQLLRDTFAGKIFSDFRGVENISEKWSEFYRQKCRAGVRTKLLFLYVY